MQSSPAQGLYVFVIMLYGVRHRSDQRRGLTIMTEPDETLTYQPVSRTTARIDVMQTMASLLRLQAANPITDRMISDATELMQPEHLGALLDCLLGLCIAADFQPEFWDAMLAAEVERQSAERAADAELQAMVDRDEEVDSPTIVDVVVGEHIGDTDVITAGDDDTPLPIPPGLAAAMRAELHPGHDSA